MLQILDNDPGFFRFGFLKDGQQMGVDDVIAAWIDDQPFRQLFINTLASASIASFFFELPALTSKRGAHPFEAALLDCPRLSQKTADCSAFKAPFAKAGSQDLVATFKNLGRDATLIAPLPTHTATDFAHLAAFSRTASSNQQHAFWRDVGLAAKDNLSDQPIWLSTSGLGVPWLHARLDSRPKYITHEAYKITT